MSKIVYLLGAGASYGKRGEDKIKCEVERHDKDGRRIITTMNCPTLYRGVPIVSELPSRLFYMYAWLDDEINKIKNDSLDKRNLEKLAEDINWLHNESGRHATIDTFAKKLYLIGREDDYCRLKRAFTIFLMWEQMNKQPDIRYDSFFAAILGDIYDDFPKEVSIVSWNYDCQLELAYREYCRIDSISGIAKKLGVKDKELGIKSDDSAGLKIMKLNGCALIEDNHYILDPFFDTTQTPIGRVLSLYKHSEGDRTLLSFAWEKMNDEYKSMISTQVGDAETVVVIGYSFPFFNRKVDRFLFESMPNLKNIYIQDPYADRIVQTLPSVIPSHIYPITKVEKITTTDQFYLPPEL